MSEYRTNLTEQQYRSQEGRVAAYAKRLREQLKQGNITEDEYRSKVIDAAKRLGLTIFKDENGRDNIVTASYMFYDESKDYREELTRHEIKKMFSKDEVSIPRHFVTVSNRDEPCKIVEEPAVKNIMINASDYSYRTNREMRYSLCQTPHGIKVTSRAFGDKNSVSSIYGMADMCEADFGKGSKEIGEFHTHPGISGYDIFSGGDLIFHSFKDNIDNYNNSVCVVNKIKDKNKKLKTRVRCSTNKDMSRFLRQLNIYPKSERTREELINNRFLRDPNLQNSFSCVVEIPNKIPKANRKPKLLSPAPKPKAKKVSGFDFGEGLI